MAKLVYALDYNSVSEARYDAKLIQPLIGMIKVGSQLFIKDGKKAVGIGKDLGIPVFLDLKLKDIPETVYNAVASAADLGARYITIHADGGKDMLIAAYDAGIKYRITPVAITVLTSFTDQDLSDINVKLLVKTQVFKLAKMAEHCGIKHFVCSAQEIATLRSETSMGISPGATLFVPGIRLPDNLVNDQKRIGTPYQAAKDGADWLIIGRAIRNSKDKYAAAMSIYNEINSK